MQNANKTLTFKYNRYVFSVLVLLAGIVPGACKSGLNLASGPSGWNASDYRRYNYSSFAQLRAANYHIDFENVDYPLLEAAIFYETNRARAQHDLRPYKYSIALGAAARSHSRDMVKLKFFSHINPRKGYTHMKDRLKQVGVTGGYRAENIAEAPGIFYEPGKRVYTPDQNDGYFSYEYQGEPIPRRTYLQLGQKLVEIWLNSPDHRANVLNKRYTYLGCGAWHYKKTTFFNLDNFKATQNFGTLVPE